MKAKTFEVRDRATFIPVLAVRLEPDNPQDRYLFYTSGFGKIPTIQKTHILLTNLQTNETLVNPYDWYAGRTMRIIHMHLVANFEEIESGSVLDVEFIKGEVKTPKLSELLTTGV